MNQMNLFDIMPEDSGLQQTKQLQVVKAQFIEASSFTWQELFEGYDELYAITFTSGIHFMQGLLEKFEYAEVIFGCEDIVDNNVAAIMAVEAKMVELITKNKSANMMAGLMKEDKLKLYVSRDLKSHEKVFVLKAKDGRVRVITGSANMSASAFCGYQRENVTFFEEQEAFEWYYERFMDFREKCADNVNQQVVERMVEGEDNLLRENPEEIPIFQTVKSKKIVVIEKPEDETDYEVVADVTGFRDELKTMLPKPQKNGMTLLTAEALHVFKRKYSEHRQVKEIKDKKLPKLHVDYESGTMNFNGKACNLKPDPDKIKSDINCLKNYLSSLTMFYGDVEQSQKDYFGFMNWYFASLFMPYLRYVAVMNNYDVTPFPVIGIIYGDSNGGKSTFIRLLSKMMCEVKVPLNSSSDFTASNIEDLKRGCEGLPINIDDLSKAQYSAHFEKVIKDDVWGIRDHFINYPSIAITTNKVPSLTADISKRAIACHINTKIDKEIGVKNSKMVNESMRHATNSLYCEYVRRMLEVVAKMVEMMKYSDNEYFPDIFEASSTVLVNIFNEYGAEAVPEYIRILTYADYFGNKAVGRNAIQKIIIAWQNEADQFVIDKKKNKLTYSYPDGGRTYELKYIFDELPPVLNAQLVSRSIVMELDKAQEFFDVEFRKRGWFR